MPAGATTIALRIFGRIYFQAGLAGSRQIQFLQNGSIFGQLTVPADASIATSVVNFDVAPLAAVGDVLTMCAYQTGGANVNVTAIITVERAGVTS